MGVWSPGSVTLAYVHAPSAPRDVPLLFATRAVRLFGFGLLSVVLVLYLFTVHPALALIPVAAIALAVYGFNMLGDATRDVFDPRLRGAR